MGSASIDSELTTAQQEAAAESDRVRPCYTKKWEFTFKATG